MPAGATPTCCRWFKKAERNERLHDEFHGTDGPLNVAERPYTNPLSHVFVEAAQQAGLPFNPDFNGAAQLGCGLFQVTQKNGRRWSAASAYLHPAAARKNLTIITKAQATRVLIEKGRAVGVEYVRRRKRYVAGAGQEVVLAGGAINSPQLLLLSGIGPAAELRTLGVRVALDLPGVGKNLQDHLNVNIVARAKRGSTLDSKSRGLAPLGVALEFLLYGTGPGTSNVAEAGAFAMSDLGAATPDIQYHFIPAQVVDHARTPMDGDGVTLHACCLRPQSRGEIRLASSDPLQPPVMDPNYLAAAYDLKILIDGLAEGPRDPGGAGLQALARGGAASGRRAAIGRRAGRLHPRHCGNRVSPGRHLQDGKRCHGRRRRKLARARRRSPARHRRLDHAVDRLRQHQRAGHHDRREGRRDDAGGGKLTSKSFFRHDSLRRRPRNAVMSGGSKVRGQWISFSGTRAE